MDAVASAIADPVRREILVRLRGRPLSAGTIAERFPISRPAISRHLRVLRESGLVRDTVAGRQRLYEVDPAAFAELREWLDLFAAAGPWDRHLDALETEVFRTRRERRQDRAVIAGRPPRSGDPLQEKTS